MRSEESPPTARPTDRVLAEQASFPPGSAADVLTSEEWNWSEPQNLGPTVNCEDNDEGPFLSADGLTLLFASDRPDGHGQFDIWMSRRSTPDGKWSLPENLGDAINTEKNERGPSLSADELTLLFHSHRDEGYGSSDLWMATRESKSEPWSQPMCLDTTVNSPDVDGNPTLSADGLTMLFDSGRDDGMDIWTTARTALDVPWCAAKKVPGLSNNYAQQHPHLSADGTAVVFGGYAPSKIFEGGKCIRMSLQASDRQTWLSNEYIPVPIDSPDDEEHPALSADAKTLLFSSNRPGGQGGVDLWMSRRVPRQSEDD